MSKNFPNAISKRIFHSKLNIKPESHVCFIIKICNIFVTIFGLKKVNLLDGKLSSIGLFYKIFIIIFLCSFSISYTILVYKFAPWFLTHFHTSVIFISYLYYVILLIMQISITTSSMIFGHKIAEKIYISLSKIDNITLYEKKTFKTKWVVIYLIYTIHCMYRVINDYFHSLIIFSFLVYVCGTASDLELIHFSMIIDVVARRIEMLNDNLIHMNNITSSNIVNFHIQTDMISSVWEIRELDYTRLKSIKVIVAVFNTLHEIIDSINDCFGITVSTLYN